MAGTTWLDVSAGSNATCGVSSDNKLRCWGSQLGQSNKVPTQVDTATDWARVRIGQSHGCALKTTGSLYCWGFNASGQVGNGTLANNVTTLAQVGADGEWSSVDIGTAFTCGKKKTGGIFCWGVNANGQLGIGVADHSTPTKIGAGADWKYVAARGDATCAIAKTGQLSCWGSTQFIAPPDLRRQVPATIGLATDWATVDVGQNHACATKTDQSMHCWGTGYQGALGLGATSQATTPQSVGLKVTNMSVGRRAHLRDRARHAVPLVLG